MKLPTALPSMRSRYRAPPHPVTWSGSRSAGDPARLQDLLKTGEAKIPRATFVTALARGMVDASQLYGPRKLDDPDKLRISCTRAQDALKLLPALQGDQCARGQDHRQPEEKRSEVISDCQKIL